MFPSLDSINGAVKGSHSVVNITTVLDMLRCSICYQIIIYNQLKSSVKQIEFFQLFEKIDDKIFNKLNLNEFNYKELRWFYKIRFYLTVFYFMFVIKTVLMFSEYTEFLFNFINLTIFLFLFQSMIVGVVGNFLSTILLMIYIRFKIINKKLNEILNLKDLQLIFEIHENLCDFIRKFNEIFGLTIVCMLSSSCFLFIFILFSIYWLLTTDLKLPNNFLTIQYLTNVLWGIPCLVEITSLGFFSQLITSEVGFLFFK